jgi:hypothetical protein
MPDVNCCYADEEFWLELKISRRFVCDIKPSQVAWIAKRVQIKDNIFILVGEMTGPNFYLYKGREIFRPGALVSQSGKVQFHHTAIPHMSVGGLKDKESWDYLLSDITKCLQKKKMYYNNTLERRLIWQQCLLCKTL